MKIELVSVMLTVLEDTPAITSQTLTNNNLGLLIKLCFYMLYTPVQYNYALGMALGSFPETNAASDKNSDLLWGDQNLQPMRPNQARASSWFAHDSSHICLLFWLSD